MTQLTRQELISQLRAAHQATALDQALRTLARWAFDQFYGEEEGRLDFEPGYRRVIGQSLDDLMFSDQATFALSATDLQRMIERLEQATPTADDDISEDDEDDDADRE